MNPVGILLTGVFTPASLAGSVWTNHPYPPPFLLCKQYATSMHIAMLRLQGHSKPEEKIKSPIDYHIDATVAYNNLVKWMEKNTPHGVTAQLKWSFSFDGSDKKDKVFGDSRRIDIDVMKGEILKSF